MSPIRGVILDVDGTLVDSNDAHAHAWVEALAEAGVDVPFSTVRRLIGMGGDKLLPQVAGLHEDEPTGKAVSKRRSAIFQERYLPHVRAFPASRELLQRMRDEGLRLVVATSAKKQEMHQLLRLCGADDLIKSSTSSDDAERSKPDPDLIHAALEKLALPPAEVLMLGDTPYDIEAAGRARVRTIGLRCGGWDDAGLAGAVARYDDPADLLAHYDASPLARHAQPQAKRVGNLA